MEKNNVIDSIKNKVELLMADNKRLRTDLDKIYDQKEKLKEENREMTETVAQLRKKVSVLELKEGLGGNPSEVKQAKARVSRLMREIDKCIALLNR